MKTKLTFPYPKKKTPSTKEENEQIIDDAFPYSGDTPYERATGHMTFPLKNKIRKGIQKDNENSRSL